MRKLKNSINMLYQGCVGVFWSSLLTAASKSVYCRFFFFSISVFIHIKHITSLEELNSLAFLQLLIFDTNMQESLMPIQVLDVHQF